MPGPDQAPSESAYDRVLHRDLVGPCQHTLPGAAGHRTQHALEKPLMGRQEGVPVGQSEQPDRIEYRGLSDNRAMAVRFYLELEPGSSRQVHLSLKP